MAAFNRQELIRRAQALLERQRPAIGAKRSHWWADAAQREVEAFRAGGALPTSTGALELLAVDIELEAIV